MTTEITTKTILTDPISFLAFGFGSGLAPKAPGTFGTLACIPLWWLLSYLDITFYIIACLFVFIAGIYICGEASRKLQLHDHPGIVWDEFAGFLITMIGIQFSWFNLIAGFFFFRLFDILKPWPINWLDKRVKGGLGIMLDDILAGILALICLHLTIHFV